jgi:single-strand DNA-binding protein
MKNMNRVTLIGQLAADPEVRALPSGNSVATMRVATNFSWKDEKGEWQRGVDFHTVVAWARLAEVVGQAYKKGKSLFIEGKLRTRKYAKADGEEKYVTEVVAQCVSPMDTQRVKKPGEEAADDQAAELPIEAVVLQEDREPVAA